MSRASDEIPPATSNDQAPPDRSAGDTQLREPASTEDMEITDEATLSKNAKSLSKCIDREDSSADELEKAIHDAICTCTNFHAAGQSACAIEFQETTDLPERPVVVRLINHGDEKFENSSGKEGKGADRVEATRDVARSVLGHHKRIPQSWKKDYDEVINLLSYQQGLAYMALERRVEALRGGDETHG